jgi:hypothetical protein
MKILTRIRIIPIILVLSMLLPMAVSAALPPSMEIQWKNTQSLTCEIIILGNLGTVNASIIGCPGSTIEAEATLYKIVNGISTTIYTETVQTTTFPVARFVHEFEVESGVSYYLILWGMVSKNGVDEEICDADYETIP